MARAGEDPRQKESTVLKTVKDDAMLQAIEKADRVLERLIVQADEANEKVVGDLVDEARESLADAKKAYLRRHPPRVSPHLRRAMDRVLARKTDDEGTAA